MSSGNRDEFKGRVKESAGNLTKDKELEREGRVEKNSGKTKGKAEELIDKVKNTVTGKNN